MGKIFTLDDDVRAIASDAIDDLIDQLGKDCLLVYPPIWVPCVNCVVDSVGQKPSCRWVTGGPVQFADGSPCPLCAGEGQRADEVTDTVRMLIAMSPSAFFTKAPAGLQVPAGAIQTKGFLTDLPKVRMASELVLQPTSVLRLRYTLIGEPLDVGNIVQNRYFVALWRRVGG